MHFECMNHNPQSMQTMHESIKKLKSSLKKLMPFPKNMHGATKDVYQFE